MLKGNYTGRREFHSAFDWVFLYELPRDVIKLLWTGKHAEVLDIQLSLYKSMFVFIEELECLISYFTCIADT